MKYFIPLLFVLFSVNAYGQEVEQNDKKITELNKRLDNLLGNSKTISGDSVEYKLDRLFLEIKTIKNNLQSLQESIEVLKTNGVQIKALKTKLSDVESGKYYIVLASERSIRRAELMLKKKGSPYTAKIVKNVKGTWYHVILEESFSMRSVIQTIIDIQKKDVKDVWFVNGKKLTEL